MYSYIMFLLPLLKYGIVKYYNNLNNLYFVLVLALIVSS